MWTLWNPLHLESSCFHDHVYLVIVSDFVYQVTDGVVDVIMYPSSTDKSRNRGFAFIEYESHKAAAMARRKLIPGTHTRLSVFCLSVCLSRSLCLWVSSCLCPAEGVRTQNSDKGSSASLTYAVWWWVQVPLWLSPLLNMNGAETMSRSTDI